MKTLIGLWVPTRHESPGILIALHCPVLGLGLSLVFTIRSPFFVFDGSQVSRMYVQYYVVWDVTALIVCFLKKCM